MRLLQRSETGEFSLTKDLAGDGDIPPYAILSHTWGLDTEEVTFEDIINGTGDKKIGYQKIRFCAEQAERDGLQYFWVDTCCIDKSSSSELSESINSMYKWYRWSDVCYVYLDDVTVRKNPPWILPADEHLEEDERIRLENSDFAKSRWFTRGWTLQELLAPKEIQFYSKDWIRLGNLKELLAAVAHITNIDQEALAPTWKYFELSQICIARRMSWAARRQTTRSKDLAYCLMGIFNVQMPLLYGEGHHAFVRLQQEILKNTDDDSILAWNFPSHVTQETDYRFDELLAPTPAYFESCAKLIRRSWSESHEPWLMSNIGLTITMPLIPKSPVPGYWSSSDYYAIHDCRNEDNPDQRLALHGSTGSRTNIIKHLYLHRPRPRDSSRICRLSQRQLDNEKRTTIYKSIILLKQSAADFERRMFAEPVTVTLDPTIDGQNITHHTISIKDYYPSSAWNVESKKLVVSEWSSAESVAAVRLIFQGDNLLLVLKSVSRSSLLNCGGMERPKLFRCPRGAHSMRSLISQIPKFLKSERNMYSGPLRFQYVHRKGEDGRNDIFLRASLTAKIEQNITGKKKNNSTARFKEPESEPDACTVAEGGEIYQPLEHQYWWRDGLASGPEPTPDP